MPYNYKRQPGSRKYADYSNEHLQNCLEAVRSGEMTQRQAADHFKIPRSTIKNKLKNLFSSSPGHPKVFSQEEELAFASHIDKMCEYGFPLDELDLRYIVKSYLTRQGKSQQCFCNNLPGRDWTKSFLKRHPQLTVRLSSNIKRNRAQIDEKIISDYIDNLKEVVKDVPADNIYNYDETCMSDDPGKKKVICRRGSKYPERIMNSTKTNISVMFCGNARGNSLPPYVIYKGEHLWTTWTENGPEGTRYNRTKQGWIDGSTFEEWFSTHLLPILKKQEGKKVVIGDNLSSHVSLNVLRLCEENNIRFICLPPNSTHLTQPLDLAYFRPLKIKWRQVLTEWKQSESGKSVATLPKDMFPRLLKKALVILEENVSENMKAGFRKAGIYPINKEEILKRLPSTKVSINLELVGETFIKHLQEKRQEVVQPRATKRQKLDVPAGKSITSADVLVYQEKKEQEKAAKKKEKENNKNRAKIQKEQEKQNKKLDKDKKCGKSMMKKNRNKRKASCSSTDRSDDDFSLVSSGHSEMVLSHSEDEDFDKPIEEPFDQPEEETVAHKIDESHPSTSKQAEDKSQEGNVNDILQEGNFVIVRWNGLRFPGLTVTVSGKGAIVDCMVRTSKFWKWPKEKDILFYNWEDIEKIILPPKLLKRGLFMVNGLNDFYAHSNT